MFPRTHNPARSAPRSMRAAIRDAADLAVAFLTLESYGLDDLRRSRSSRAHDHASIGTGDATGHLESPPGSRGAGGALPPPEPHALLRRELRPHLRARRPGTTTPREQLCLSDASVQAMASSGPTQRRRTAPEVVSP